MSAHVLLNVLIELGMPSILSLFRNEFNKFKKKKKKKKKQEHET